MMFGGGLMMVMGLLVMLLVFGLPVLLIVVLAGGLTGFLQKQNRLSDGVQRPLPVASNPAVQPEKTATSAPRYCVHCGAGLQADWTHCPQCGAPVN